MPTEDTARTRQPMWSSGPAPRPLGTSVAIDDESTMAALATMRTRARLPIEALFGAAAVVLVTAALATVLDAPDWARGVLTVVAFLVGFARLLALGSHPLRRRVTKQTKRVLEDAPWRPVEVVTVKGAPIDPGVSVVLVLDSAKGELAGSWIIDQRGRPGWPPRDERCWAYLAVARDGRSAVLAPPERDRLTALKQRGALRTGPASHEWAWTEARSRWTFPQSASAATGTSPAFEAGAVGTVHRRGDRSLWPNRELTAGERVAILVALLVVSLGLTANTFRLDRHETARERALLASGSRSHAEVENVFRGMHADDVQLTILIIDGDAVGWEVRVGVAQQTSLRRGDRIEVAYNRRDPGNLIVLGQHRAPRDGLASGAWIVMGLVAMRFGWRASRRQRDKS